MITVQLNDADLQKFLRKYKVIMPEEMRIGILNSLAQVGRIATSKYMKRRTIIDKKTGAVGARSGSKLNIMTGRLARSISQSEGVSDEMVKKVFNTGGQFVGILGSTVPYARIHEKGGHMSTIITPKMRKFFWAKFYDTGEGMWKGMALSKGIERNVPARPYLEPAAEDSKDWIINHLKMQMEKVITKAEV